jgi:hypothetical protein
MKTIKCVRYEVSKTFRHKKDKMSLKQTEKNIMPVQRINGFKKGSQLGPNLVKIRMIRLQIPTILSRCKNYFCQLLNVNGFNSVRQTEIHVAEPNSFEVLSAVKKQN